MVLFFLLFNAVTLCKVHLVGPTWEDQVALAEHMCNPSKRNAKCSSAHGLSMVVGLDMHAFGTKYSQENAGNAQIEPVC